jgi:hypothetical protein
VTWLLAALVLMPEVRGELDCPSPAAVESRLEELLPPPGTALDGHVVELAREGEALVVRLRQADGTVVGTRQLPTRSCAEQAEAAAVVVAAWDAQVGEAPLLPGGFARASAPPAPTSATWALSAAAFASVDRLSTAPSGRLGVSWLGAISLGASISATGAHSASLAGGSGNWRRVALLLSGGRRLALAAWQMDVGAEAIASLLMLQGRGYPQNYDATLFHPGAGAFVRVGRRIGPLALWVGIEGLWWLRPQRLFVERTSNTADVPKLEAMFGTGVELPL